MLTVQIASDLHIEYKNDTVPDPLDLIMPAADILILAGDIGSLYKEKQLREFLTRVCQLFQYVIYVPGNHERYVPRGYQPLSWQALDRRLTGLEKNIDNLHILNRSSVRLGNVCIVGATLWSNLKCKLPTYRVRIHGLTERIYRDEYRKDLHYLEKMFGYCQKHGYRLLVVTHYPPSDVCGWHDPKWGSLYTTNLEHLLTRDNAHTWISGHVHNNYDFVTEGGTRLVGNQFGKGTELVKGYRKDFIISV